VLHLLLVPKVLLSPQVNPSSSEAEQNTENYRPINHTYKQVGICAYIQVDGTGQVRRHLLNECLKCYKCAVKTYKVPI